MKRKTSPTVIELKKKVQEIKKKNLLPYNYAADIATKLGIDRNKIYQVMSGKSANLEIIELILLMAKDNKEKQLLDLANEILED